MSALAQVREIVSSGDVFWTMPNGEKVLVPAEALPLLRAGACENFRRIERKGKISFSTTSPLAIAKESY